ncbi:MAG: hypothetical protein AAFZ01_02940 [Pseudomonadota bacterium]
MRRVRESAVVTRSLVAITYSIVFAFALAGDLANSPVQAVDRSMTVQPHVEVILTTFNPSEYAASAFAD